MQTYTHKTEIPIEEESIRVKATYHIKNNGIGSYEYWGAKCYDRGHDYPEIDDIEPIWFNETDKEKLDILFYIDENFEHLAEYITEKMVNEEEF